MGRPCTICAHPQREGIQQALAAGDSFRDVAVSYAVSKTALRMLLAYGDWPSLRPSADHLVGRTAGG